MKYELQRFLDNFHQKSDSTSQIRQDTQKDLLHLSKRVGNASSNMGSTLS